MKIATGRRLVPVLFPLIAVGVALGTASFADAQRQDDSDAPQPPRIEQQQQNNRNNSPSDRRFSDGQAAEPRQNGLHEGERVYRGYRGLNGHVYNGGHSADYRGHGHVSSQGGHGWGGHGSCGGHGYRGGQHYGQPQHQYQDQDQQGEQAFRNNNRQRYGVVRTTPQTNPNRPVLGVRIRNVDNGVHIVSVRPNSPAQRAGLQEGDVVISIDGRQVQRTDQLLSRLRAMQRDDEVSLQINRNGQTQDISTSLTTYRQAFGDERTAANEPPDPPQEDSRRIKALRPNIDQDDRDQDNRIQNNRDRDRAKAASDDLDLPEAPQPRQEDGKDADSAQGGNVDEEPAKSAINKRKLNNKKQANSQDDNPKQPEKSSPEK